MIRDLASQDKLDVAAHLLLAHDAAVKAHVWIDVYPQLRRALAAAGLRLEITQAQVTGRAPAPASCSTLTAGVRSTLIAMCLSTATPAPLCSQQPAELSMP